MEALRKNLQNIIEQNIGWSSVVSFMRSYHPGFIPKIKMKYSDLGDTELRHCCYMKLGLSVSEVSNILQQSEKSVELVRDRVRNLFSLKINDSLREYIESV